MTIEIGAFHSMICHKCRTEMKEQAVSGRADAERNRTAKARRSVQRIRPSSTP